MTDQREKPVLLEVSRAPRQAIFDRDLPHVAFRFLCLIAALDTGPEFMRVDPPGWVRLRTAPAAGFMGFGEGPDAEQQAEMITRVLIDRGYIEYMPPQPFNWQTRPHSFPPRYRVKFTSEDILRLVRS